MSAMYRKGPAPVAAGGAAVQSDMARYDKGNPDGGSFDPTRKRKGRAASDLIGPAPAGAAASKPLLGS